MRNHGDQESMAAVDAALQSMPDSHSGNAMDIEPPEDTKKIADCKFRTSDHQCCYALNPLRPHLCNKYCVERLYLWLKTAHPELDEVSRMDLIVELTKVEADA